MTRFTLSAQQFVGKVQTMSYERRVRRRDSKI